MSCINTVQDTDQSQCVELYRATCSVARKGVYMGTSLWSKLHKNILMKLIYLWRDTRDIYLKIH